MKQIHYTLFAASLLLSCVSPTHASEVEINVRSVVKTETPVKYIGVEISAGSGIIFTLYLTSSDERSTKLLSVLGSYAVPTDFPSPGFRTLTEVSIGSDENDDGKMAFKRAYTTKILQSPEFSVYSIATNSAMSNKSQAHVENISFLSRLCGTASRKVNIIRLANWSIKGDSTMSAIQLNLAYSKDVGKLVFCEQVYTHTGLLGLKNLTAYPITFSSQH
jgi:hypothetical protein